MTVQPLEFDLAAALARQPRRRLIAMAEAAGVIEDSYRVLDADRQIAAVRAALASARAPA